jgi:hypothetical protein
MPLRRISLTGLTLAAISAGVVVAEPLSRLRGRTLTPNGDAVSGADVRIEARFGSAGGDFGGQRRFSAQSSAKGDWSLIAFKPGIWIVDASAPGRLPDAVALPFNLVTPAGQGFADAAPSWQVVLRLAPVPDDEIGRKRSEAAAAARAGEIARVTPMIVELGADTAAALLTALGRICLVGGDAAAARAFFHRAQDRDPASFGAALGMASAALLQRDFDAASRAFGASRDRTANADERAFLTAAIADVSRIHVTAPGSGLRSGLGGFVRPQSRAIDAGAAAIGAR